MIRHNDNVVKNQMDDANPRMIKTVTELSAIPANDVQIQPGPATEANPSKDCLANTCVAEDGHCPMLTTPPTKKRQNRRRKRNRKRNRNKSRNQRAVNEVTEEQEATISRNPKLVNDKNVAEKKEENEKEDMYQPPRQKAKLMASLEPGLGSYFPITDDRVSVSMEDSLDLLDDEVDECIEEAIRANTPQSTTSSNISDIMMSPLFSWSECEPGSPSPSKLGSFSPKNKTSRDIAIDEMVELEIMDAFSAVAICLENGGSPTVSAVEIASPKALPTGPSTAPLTALLNVPSAARSVMDPMGSNMAPNKAMAQFPVAPVAPPNECPEWIAAHFQQMGMRQILNLRMTMKEIIECGVFPRFVEHREPCNYMQHLVENIHPNDPAMGKLVRFLGSDPINVVANVLEHQYGNFFVQTLFSKNMPFLHELLLRSLIYPFVLRLSMHIYGCRVIQKVMTSAVVPAELKWDLVRNLVHQISSCDDRHRIMRNLLISKNSNHVLMKVLGLGMPAEDLDCIKEGLERDLISNCRHVSACRVVQAYIENYGDRLDVSPLLRNNNHIQLAQVEYGNHVIQCILDRKAWYSQQSVFVEFRQQFLGTVFQRKNLLRLSHGKHGSHVLERCIISATPEQMECLVKRVCSRPRNQCLLRKLVLHEFGNYVLRTMFDRCSSALKAVVADAVHRKVKSLDSMYWSEVVGETEFVQKVFHFINNSGSGRW